jgi:hypothetical protein
MELVLLQFYLLFDLPPFTPGAFSLGISFTPCDIRISSFFGNLPFRKD